MQLWAAAIHAGLSDAVFWELAPPELLVYLRVHREADRVQALRFGLVAATLVNINRRPGTPVVRPEDFFEALHDAPEYMTTEEARTMLTTWADEHNAALANGAARLVDGYTP